MAWFGLGSGLGLGLALGLGLGLGLTLTLTLTLTRRKVVIGTNIAETSITIPDCVYVVDTGRLKETRYDALNGLPQLADAWIVSASRRQRRAREP